MGLLWLEWVNLALALVFGATIDILDAFGPTKNNLVVMVGFKTDYAASGRATCRGCRSAIGKGTLRLARLTPSPFFDGLQPNYFHFRCFFAKGEQPQNTADIEGFDLLRLEDQEKIQKKIEEVLVGASATNNDSEHLKMEYAPSSRAKCRKCEESIQKNELRLGVMMDPPPELTFRARVPWWYHRRCFAFALLAHKISLASLQPESFQGSKHIRQEDIEDIRKLFKQARKEAGITAQKPLGKRENVSHNNGEKNLVGESSITPQMQGSCRKTKHPKVQQSAKPETFVKAPSPEEQAFREQVTLIWKHKDHLSKLTTTAMKNALAVNGCETHGGPQALLDRLVDGLLFGKLLPCKKCGDNRWRYTSSGYECQGHVDEWEPCALCTKNPPRGSWKLTDDIKILDSYQKFKFKKCKRLFNPAAREAAANMTYASQQLDKYLESKLTDHIDEKKIDSKAPKQAQTYLVQDCKPLHGLHIAVAGRISQTQQRIKHRIEKLGGSFYVGTIGSTVTCVLSSESEVTKATNSKIKDALKFGVPIVSIDWLNDCEASSSCALLATHALAHTSTIVEPSKHQDHMERLMNRKLAIDTGPALTGSSTDNSQKKIVVVKGRVAVEDEDLVSTHHVLDEGKTVWNASLVNTDLKRNTNSYYKLQLLVPDSKRGRTYLYRSWGRLGTTQGGAKTVQLTLSAAKTEFCKLFFEKVPGAFYPLDIAYDEPLTDIASTKSLSILQRPVAELNLSRLPLGKLTKEQLSGSLEVLSALQDIIDDESLSQHEKESRLLGCSNKFYTYIPHDFGFRAPPIIANNAMIKKKVQIVEDLMNLEVASRLLEDSKYSSGSMLDVYYHKLKTDIDVLPKRSKEFRMIETYVKNSHAETHNQFNLEIVERLLWHGSRLTNFVGILSEGLRIAPPTAPATGYMFGKGIYLADMVSKSANYCHCTSSSPSGLLLLCEAALGNMLECTNAEYIERLPKGKHSTFGKGKTCPDPAESITIDNVQVPLGPAKPSGVKHSSLLYNEFIVYDVAQVQIRYMLRVNFKFKSRSM
eukprot:gene5117-156_t